MHVFSFLRLLGFFFNREKPVPVGGSNITVQAASYGDDGIVNHGASWRFVIDTKDMSNGYHITRLNTEGLDGKRLTLTPK